jgi:hypothetical protein
MVVVFMLIMISALAVALVAGWVTWQREENARAQARSRQDELELAERRLERAADPRPKDRP